MEPASVLVVGSLNMDLVVPVPRHPKPGETVVGGDLRRFPGGKGANQAVAAARLGARVRMIGRVGADAYGAELGRGLEAEGIETADVAELDAPTGVALIGVSEDGQNAIVVSPGANARLRPEDLAPERFAGPGSPSCSWRRRWQPCAAPPSWAGRRGRGCCSTPRRRRHCPRGC